MKRYKPKPKYKILTIHWWNPFAILALLITPPFMFFYCGVIGFYEGVESIIDGIKKWDWQ